jgi:PRTRC genetic system ThiF family protein
VYHLVYEQERPRYYDRSIVVVGCGGTGSLVAESVCRLLLSVPDGGHMQLLLVDHDRVEPHNLLRQAFYAGDVGQFKSQALATRLSRLYGRPIGYSVEAFRHGTYYGDRSAISQARIVIGCVDNPLARAEIAASVEPTRWWIDAGNAENLGQVLIGNASSADALQGAFDPEKGICYALPLPSIQRPELLLPAEPPVVSLPNLDDPDCAVAVQLGGQSPVINQVMAALVLEAVRRLITATCPWMALYADMQRGELRAVEATPENAARAFGLRSTRGFLAKKRRR